MTFNIDFQYRPTAAAVNATPEDDKIVHFSFNIIATALPAKI